MNIFINIFIGTGILSFLIGVIINVFNFNNDSLINKMHIDFVRIAILLTIIALILYLINQQTK